VNPLKMVILMVWLDWVTHIWQAYLHYLITWSN